MTVGTRHAGMRMLRVYLNPAAGVMGGFADVPPANRMLAWLSAWTPPPRRIYVAAAYRHVPDFVLQLMPEDEEEEPELTKEQERQQQSLEMAVVKGLEALTEKAEAAKK